MGLFVVLLSYVGFELVDCVFYDCCIVIRGFDCLLLGLFVFLLI